MEGTNDCSLVAVDNLCRSVEYVLWNSSKPCSVESVTAVCDAIKQLIEKYQLSVLLHCVHCLQTTHAVHVQ